MKRKKIFRIIPYVMFFAIALYFFKSPILRFFTGGWQKEFAVVETDDFKLIVNENLAMGCPGHDFFMAQDSIGLIHYTLPEILRSLTDRHLNNSVMIGYDSDGDADYNFYFKSKDSTRNAKTYLPEILNVIGKEFGFTHKTDTVNKVVYYAELVDQEKLLTFLTDSFEHRYSVGDDYMKFYGDSINSIFEGVTQQIKGLFVKSNIRDSLCYQIYVPSKKKEEIVSFFNTDVGVQLESRNEEVTVLSFTFVK